MVKQSLGSRYFSGINIATPLEFEVNPAYLSKADRDDNDSLAWLTFILHKIYYF